MSRLVLNIDSTSLGTSACEMNYWLTVVGNIENGVSTGGYRGLPGASMVYGIAVHKFVDVMYKTGGHYPTARREAEQAFSMKKLPPSSKSGHLGDPKHLITTCFNLWNEYIENDSTFDVIQIPVECYHCKGTGVLTSGNQPNQDTTCRECSRCLGTKTVMGPATEVTFRIPFYDTPDILINLCGTIDRLGQFRGGCYAIPDWKTTSSWDKDKYMSQYELNRQLRIYRLALRLMNRMYPDSTLGKFGATNVGACIDAIFIKAKPNDVEYMRSDVYQFSEATLDETEAMLMSFCIEFADRIRQNRKPRKTGIINGTCSTKYGKCSFWHVCKSNEQVGEVLLKRDFVRKIYDPLSFNE